MTCHVMIPFCWKIRHETYSKGQCTHFCYTLWRFPGGSCYKVWHKASTQHLLVDNADRICCLFIHIPTMNSVLCFWISFSLREFIDEAKSAGIFSFSFACNRQMHLKSPRHSIRKWIPWSSEICREEEFGSHKFFKTLFAKWFQFKIVGTTGSCWNEKI